MPPLSRGCSVVCSTFLALALATGTLSAAAGPRQGDGRSLAVELGCGACHAGAPAPLVARQRAPALGAGGPPLSAAFVFEYLGSPQRRRADIGATRMPDFRLDEGERAALALFLGTGGEQGALAEARRRHPAADAERGRRIFSALGCAGCHGGVEGTAGVTAPDLSREGARVRREWLLPWLKAPSALRGPANPKAPGARMPDFRLTGAEAEALAGWILELGAPFTDLPERSLTLGERRRVDRFLEDRTACLGCHRIGGRGGRIGPSLDGVARRARPSFVLEIILDPGRAAPGSPMPHQPMARRDAELLALRVLELSAAAPGGAPPTPAPFPSLAEASHPAWVALGSASEGDESRGPALYARHCAACHGAQGRGDGWNAPDLDPPPARLADSAAMERRVNDALFDAVHAGGWVLGRSARMPAFGGLLPPEDIRALVSYIRSLCACEAPAWSRDGTRRRP